MANIKTAVSIEKSLFEQAEDMAHKMNMSRSRLFALAPQVFIRRLQNEELLQRINEAYQDVPDPDEQAHFRMIGTGHPALSGRDSLSPRSGLNWIYALMRVGSGIGTES